MECPLRAEVGEVVAVLLQEVVVLGVAIPGQVEEEVEEGHHLQVKVVVEGEVEYPNQAEKTGLLHQAKVVVEVVEGIQDMGGEELEAASVSPHLANVEEEGEVTSWHLGKSGPGVALLKQ